MLHLRSRIAARLRLHLFPNRVLLPTLRGSAEYERARAEDAQSPRDDGPHPESACGARLNLGAGDRIMPGQGWIHHDRWKHRPEIEVAWDLQEFPWPWPDNAFDEVFAWDVLEHLYPSPVRALEEIWRIARPGAIVTIHVPWAGQKSGAREVWRDPTHIRPWHELTMMYFDPINGLRWYEEYGKFYSHARFEQLKIRPDPPDNILFVVKVIKT